MRLSLLTPCLKSSDLLTTVAFYVELLGFRVETLWPPDEPSLAVLDHGPSEHEVAVSLMFYAEDMYEGEPPPTMTGQLTLDVDDVLALHESLEGRAEILWGPEVYHYGRREFSIADPDGYRLVFTEPTEDEPEDGDESGGADEEE